MTKVAILASAAIAASSTEAHAVRLGASDPVKMTEEKSLAVQNLAKDEPAKLGNNAILHSCQNALAWANLGYQPEVKKYNEQFDDVKKYNEQLYMEADKKAEMITTASRRLLAKKKVATLRAAKPEPTPTPTPAPPVEPMSPANHPWLMGGIVASPFVLLAALFGARKLFGQKKDDDDDSDDESGLRGANAIKKSGSRSGGDCSTDDESDAESDDESTSADAESTKLMREP
jgi:hypothetical protein